MVRLATLALMGVHALASALPQGDSVDAQDDGGTTTSTSASTPASVPPYHIVSAVYPEVADPTNTIYASVISVAPSATTFLMCAQDIPSCEYNWTMTAGPSIAGIYMSAEGLSVNISCAITKTADAAFCTVSNSGDGPTPIITSAVSLTGLASQGFNSTVTVTAGYEKITAAAGSDGDGNDNDSDNQSDDGNKGDDGDSAASRFQEGGTIAALAAIAGGLVLL